MHMYAVLPCLMPLARLGGENLVYSFKRMFIRWSANCLSDQLMLRVLLNPLYVQLCLQMMYVLTAAPEYIGSTNSADDSVVP
jgi:hypothetical protein